MFGIVLLVRVFQRGGDAVALIRIVVDEIGDPQQATLRSFDKLESRRGVDPLPLAQCPDDVLRFFDFVLRTQDYRVLTNLTTPPLTASYPYSF